MTAIGSHPIVSRFMKGTYEHASPTPPYQSTWDGQPVLSYLSGLSPTEKLDLKSANLKEAMLAHVYQTLDMPRINFLKDTSSSLKFVLPDQMKQRRPGYRAPPGHSVSIS